MMLDFAFKIANTVYSFNSSETIVDEQNDDGTLSYRRRTLNEYLAEAESDHKESGERNTTLPKDAKSLAQLSCSTIVINNEYGMPLVMELTPGFFPLNADIDV